MALLDRASSGLLRPLAHAIVALGRAMVALGVAALISTTAADARAGELEYQNCMRQICSYAPDQAICAQSCLGELNGAPAPYLLPPIPTLYAAIAVETATLITGFAKGAASRADAERQALAQCQSAGGSQSGCQIAVWGHNSCLALATSHAAQGHDNSWGYAYSDDGWVSRRNAVRECQKIGGTGCTVAVSVCSG